MFRGTVPHGCSVREILEVSALASNGTAGPVCKKNPPIPPYCAGPHKARAWMKKPFSSMCSVFRCPVRAPMAVQENATGPTWRGFGITPHGSVALLRTVCCTCPVLAHVAPGARGATRRPMRPHGRALGVTGANWARTGACLPAGRDPLGSDAWRRGYPPRSRSLHGRFLVPHLSLRGAFYLLGATACIPGRRRRWNRPWKPRRIPCGPAGTSPDS